MLAGDIHAQPAGNRTPGVPSGTNRNTASLQLLVFLFGSVTDNQAIGSTFEKWMLSELGFPKNTTVWKPDPGFEGKLDPKGTIVDADGDNFLAEIKNTKDLQYRYQIRAEEQEAHAEGKPLWIFAKERTGGKVSPNVIEAAEETGGGVIYVTDSGQFRDGHGNNVDVEKDGNKLSVSGYTRSSPTPGGGAGPVSPDEPDEPATPIDPNPPSGTGASGGGGEGTVNPGDAEDLPEDVPDVPIDPIP